MMRNVLLAALFITSVSYAAACNIPVFRYALERWAPDACEILVFHEHQLTASQQRMVESLESRTQEKGGLANATVKRCFSKSELGAQHQRILDSLAQGSDVVFPLVVVRTTVGNGRAINHWQGTLEEAVQANFFESPVRAELGRRLLAGDSVVWLLLKSSDPQRTKDAREMLRSNFKTLATKISMPEGIGLPGSELHSEVPLLLKFSMLEIDPADPKERFLVDLLSGFHPTSVASGDPLLVPVFGRGRALEVIPAEDLNPHLIADLTMFLSAACSCQVKERNPGFDLLLSADWDTMLFGEDGARPPPAKTVGDRKKAPILLTIPPGRGS